MRLCLTLLFTLVVSLSAHAQSDPYARVGVGDRLPAFEVTMTDGKTISTEELEGKVVWITLWASWCPSCRKEFKRLERNEAFGVLLEREGFIFLPIAREENVATVTAWLNKKGYTFPSGVDPERTIYSLFAEQEIPRNIIVAPDGTIVHHSSTYSAKDLEELIDTTEQMLN